MLPNLSSQHRTLLAVVGGCAAFAGQKAKVAEDVTAATSPIVGPHWATLIGGAIAGVVDLASLLALYMAAKNEAIGSDAPATPAIEPAEVSR